jgi:preprotein translocase subunit SecE
MSRAMRRQGARTKAGAKGGQKSAAPPRPTTRRPQQQASSSGGASSFLRPHWATEIVSELRKVTWPSREDTWYLTLVVLVVAGAFGVFLGGVDMFFNWVIDRVLF